MKSGCRPTALTILQLTASLIPSHISDPKHTVLSNVLFPFTYTCYQKTYSFNIIPQFMYYMFLSRTPPRTPPPCLCYPPPPSMGSGRGVGGGGCGTVPDSCTRFYPGFCKDSPNLPQMSSLLSSRLSAVWPAPSRKLYSICKITRRTCQCQVQNYQFCHILSEINANSSS
jgi:hypothetical protein